MGKAVVRYFDTHTNSQAWGVIRENNVYPLHIDCVTHQEIMALYESDPDAFSVVAEAQSMSMGELKIEAPVFGEIQLFCQGLNYLEHIQESGAAVVKDEESLIFVKASSSICAPNETIIRPKGCKLLDYEIELALVLKKPICQPLQINETDLKDYVGALVMCNDVSARDIMFGAPMLQWFRGKSMRTFCPMGPVLYLMDECDFEHLYELQLTLKLNGEVKQSSTTDLLIHRPAATLSDISSFADLKVGDCLLTGTPGGVLARSSLKVAMSILANFQNDAKRKQKFTKAQLQQSQFLEPGDFLELTISTPDRSIDLGVQNNTIRDD